MSTMKEPATSVLRRGWPIVLTSFVFGGMPALMDALFGPKWQFITGLVTLTLWLVMRPWQWCLATPTERREVRFLGTIGLCGLVLSYALQYFSFRL